MGFYFLMVKGKKMMKYFVSLIAVIALSGCENLAPLSSEQLASENFGKKPEDIEKILRPHFARTLFEPSSVLDLSVSEPEKCVKKKGIGQEIFGWCASYEYNAKNKVGVYVGMTKHTLMIVNDRIIYQDDRFVRTSALE